ncbi:HAMP domain-containing protein [Malonomonas rubra DSM 5091]|uniref:HAMP domain-containing protein n=1 Tax=Malonomonas rubra DSM 5091 TaxID=1122189 RepID=A0A1M6BFX3_MALRU|nr:methyl-accepting chemotaxis protein [Malonomonas rubra]SHI47498.1 HAMP domain-containing protein [Malonomonas rubra DSM 5091]
MAIKTQGLKIRTKLLAMVLLLILVALSVGAATFYLLNMKMDEHKPQLVPALETTYSIDSLIAKARLFEKEFLFYSSLGKKKEYKEKQISYHQQMLATYNNIGGLLKDFSAGGSNQFSTMEKRNQLSNNIRLSFNGMMNGLRGLSKELLDGKSALQVDAQYAVYQKGLNELTSSVAEMRRHINQALDAQQEASAAFEKNIQNILIGVAVGILVLAVIAGIFVSRRISSQLNILMGGLENIKQGNLKEIPVTSKDEFAEIAKTFNQSLDSVKSFVRSDEERQASEENVINFLEVVSEASEGDLTLRAPVTEDAFGTIADSYNLMIESLAALLTDTTINAEEVGEESRHLLEIFQNMKDGADNQLQHVSSAIDAAEETAGSAKQIAQKTSLAQQAATSVEEATNLGNERVNRNIEGMQLIRVTVQVINKKMKSLSERLLEIGTISQLISDVATRTTILAMNASIEASRAGEQGRGFLVISDEIKRLADEASEATRQIGGIIKAIQSEANEVTLALEEETTTVEEQTKIAQDTGEALAAINQATTESKQVVTEITNLSQEQQRISDDMVATIHKMSEITASTSAMITTSSQISEGLNGVSESLLQSLGQFRLSADEEEMAYDAVAEIETVAEPQEKEIPADVMDQIFADPEEEEESISPEVPA